MNFKPFVVKQFQQYGEISFSFLRENQLSVFGPHSYGCGCSFIGIVTTEWNLNFPDTGNDVIIFQRNL